MSEQPPVLDGGDLAGVLALADRVRQSPDDAAAAALLAQRSRSRAWLGEIPAAQEAVVDVLRQLASIARSHAPDQRPRPRRRFGFRRS